MERKQITIVVAVITNEKGEILLAKRNQPDSPEIHGKWEFVGGGVEFGEEPVAALKREVMEEIGVDIQVVRLLPKVISDIQNFADGGKLQVLAIAYECKIISGIPQANLEEEIGEVKFFPRAEISQLDAFKNIYQTLDLLF